MNAVDPVSAAAAVVNRHRRVSRQLAIFPEFYKLKGAIVFARRFDRNCSSALRRRRLPCRYFLFIFVILFILFVV